MVKIKIETQNLDWLLDTGAGRKALSAGLTQFTLSLFRSVQRVIDEGRAFTPRTHHLQQNIRANVDEEILNQGKAEIVADTSYAYYVEFGTRPHVIRPKKRSVLRWALDEKKCEEKIKNAKGNKDKDDLCWVYAKYVNHPGSKPYPFFRKAIEEGLEEAKKEFVQAFLEELRRE